MIHIFPILANFVNREKKLDIWYQLEINMEFFTLPMSRLLIVDATSTPPCVNTERNSYSPSKKSTSGMCHVASVVYVGGIRFSSTSGSFFFFPPFLSSFLSSFPPYVIIKKIQLFDVPVYL